MGARGGQLVGVRVPRGVRVPAVVGPATDRMVVVVGMIVVVG